MILCPFRKNAVTTYTLDAQGRVKSTSSVETFDECLKDKCMAWVEGPEKGYFYCVRLGAYPIAEYPDRVSGQQIEK